jgi:hypothetical protein
MKSSFGINISHFTFGELVNSVQRSNHMFTFFTGLRFTSPCAITYRGFAPLL